MPKLACLARARRAARVYQPRCPAHGHPPGSCTVPGVYIHERALFDTLLADQERMTVALVALIEPPAKESVVAGEA